MPNTTFNQLDPTASTQDTLSGGRNATSVDSLNNTWGSNPNSWAITNGTGYSNTPATTTPAPTDTWGDNPNSWAITNGTGYSNTPANTAYKGSNPVVPPTPTAGSGTFGYHYDRATNQYVDANGVPAPNTTGDPSLPGYTPNTNPAAGPSPFGSTPLMSSPTGANALGGAPIPYNNTFYGTQDTANTMAKMLGGTVVNMATPGMANDQPQWGVKLPNGQTVNAGAFASLYSNPFYNQNQGLLNGELLKLVNGSDISTPTNGSYVVGPDGKLTYNASKAWQAPQFQVSAPDQMTAYNKLLTAAGQPSISNSAISPLTGPQPWSQFTTGAPQQAPQQTQAPQYDYSGLQGLAALYQAFQQQQGGGGGNVDWAQLMKLFGQDNSTGSLYSRSRGQYPRFP